jgi:hypothetical protein
MNTRRTYRRRTVMLIACLGRGCDEGLGPSLLRLVGRVPRALPHSPAGTSFASIADVTRPKQRAWLVPPCRTDDRGGCAAQRSGDRDVKRYGADATCRPNSVSLQTSQSGFSGFLNQG